MDANIVTYQLNTRLVFSDADINPIETFTLFNIRGQKITVIIALNFNEICSLILKIQKNNLTYNEIISRC